MADAFLSGLQSGEDLFFRTREMLSSEQKYREGAKGRELDTAIQQLRVDQAKREMEIAGKAREVTKSICKEMLKLGDGVGSEVEKIEMVQQSIDTLGQTDPNAAALVRNSFSYMFASSAAKAKDQLDEKRVLLAESVKRAFGGSLPVGLQTDPDSLQLALDYRRATQENTLPMTSVAGQPSVVDLQQMRSVVERYKQDKLDEAAEQEGRLSAVKKQTEASEISKIERISSAHGMDQKQSEIGRELYKDFRKSDEVKEFLSAKAGLQMAEALTKKPSAAGDLAFIFKFMKGLDPASVVRETEFKSVAELGSYINGLQAKFNKVRTGEILTESVRADLLRVSKLAARIAAKRADARRSVIIDEGSRSGIPARFFENEELDAYYPLAGRQSGAAQPGAAQPGAGQAGRAAVDLPSVGQFKLRVITPAP